MPAILTDTLKKNVAELLLNQIQDAADSFEYYIGVGRSHPYPNDDAIVTPVRSILEEREARNNLQSVKKVTASSFVIPRRNWSSGTIYSAFDDSQVGIPDNTYYVLTEDNGVYICLQQGRNDSGVATQSTVKPDYTTAGVQQTEAFKTSDGYVWKFLYSVSATAASSFLSAGFMPISKIIGAGDDTFQQQQKAVQDAAVSGRIIGAKVISGGTGYSGDSATVTFFGTGTGASAKAFISNGSVVKVEMQNESAGSGSGYLYASASVAGSPTTAAVVRPIIGSLNGIGADARDDLKASSIMLNTKPAGEEGGDWVVDNDFRQITVFRNLEIYDSAAIFEGQTGKALRFIKMDNATAFANDDILNGPSDQKAFVVDVDSTNVFFVQNETTGFVSFDSADLIEDSDGSLSENIDSGGFDLHSIVDAHSGELLYIENRARVIRSTAQTEDIKVIITV